MLPVLGVMLMGIWPPARPSRVRWLLEMTLPVVVVSCLLLLVRLKPESLEISSISPLLWRRFLFLLSWDALIWRRTSAVSSASEAIVVTAKKQWRAGVLIFADGDEDHQQWQSLRTYAAHCCGRRAVFSGSYTACCNGRRAVFSDVLLLLMAEGRL